MIELLTIPEKEYQKLNKKLEAYKSERKDLEEMYRKRSKQLTEKIHSIQDRIARDKRIRERRGSEYIQYRNKKMLDMFKSGKSYEDLAKEFDISVATVKEKIDRMIRIGHYRKLKDHLSKTEGIVNDTLPIEALMWGDRRTMKVLNKHNIKTVGDFYKIKSKVKFSESIISKVEDEIVWASKRYFYDLKTKKKYDFYYGQYKVEN